MSPGVTAEAGRQARGANDAYGVSRGASHPAARVRGRGVRRGRRDRGRGRRRPVPAGSRAGRRGRPEAAHRLRGRRRRGHRPHRGRRPDPGHAAQPRGVLSPERAEGDLRLRGAGRPEGDRHLPPGALAVSGARTLAFLLAVPLLLGSAAAAAPPDPLTLERTIPLGQVQGRIDHMAVDLARHRLFVAELGNGSLGVVDLERGEVLKRIGGLKEPQGVAYVPGADLVYVASGGDGTLRRYTGADLDPVGATKLGEDADNVRLDPRGGRVVVGYGDGALALVDAASGEKTGEIALPGHPESFRLEADGARAFVNVPAARQVVVVDRDAGRQVAAWDVPGRDNFPMILDEAGGRPLGVGRDPPPLLGLRTAPGQGLGPPATRRGAPGVVLGAKRG